MAHTHEPLPWWGWGLLVLIILLVFGFIALWYRREKKGNDTWKQTQNNLREQTPPFWKATQTPNGRIRNE